MKRLKHLAVILVAMSIVGGPLMAAAGEQKAEPKPGTNAVSKAKAKLKPYILKTCPVSGDKLGEMGDPYVFEYEGREIKLCCKSCLKDFKKDAAKFVKKITEAEAKEKAKGKEHAKDKAKV